jgi:hypothetical protein
MLWLCASYDEIMSRVEGTRPLGGESSLDFVAPWLTVTLGMCASRKEAFDLFVDGDGLASDDFLLELALVVRSVHVLYPIGGGVNAAHTSTTFWGEGVSGATGEIIDRMEEIFAPEDRDVDTPFLVGDIESEVSVSLGENMLASTLASAATQGSEGEECVSPTQNKIDGVRLSVGMHPLKEIGLKLQGLAAVQGSSQVSVNPQTQNADSFWAQLAACSSAPPLGKGGAASTSSGESLPPQVAVPSENGGSVCVDDETAEAIRN